MTRNPLVRPESQVSTGPGVTTKDVSPERIDQADADLILVTAADTEDKPQKQQVVTNPVWKSLPAAGNGRVFEVPDEIWMSGIGVQAAERTLVDVARATGTELPRK
ncbi:ABC transporter substrate-binding protein [Streptomyces sp. ADMS]|nr:ABC transporter substrate-binding protein [Streptomyces sp. ADMS]MDW4905023.1 ABC transporter substrate-binding protein [Streptomyces sp. ADMS]